MRMESVETRRKPLNRKGATKTSQRARAAASRSKTAPRSRRATSSKGRAKSVARKPSTKPGTRTRVGASRTTTDHDEIREWAEARSGEPATVKGTGARNEAGVLRIDFPGFTGEGRLQPIDWDEWFEKFDQNKLQFLYQEKTKDGKESRFFKLVKKK